MPTDKQRLDWLEKKSGKRGDLDFNILWRVPHTPSSDFGCGKIACFGNYAGTVRRAIDAAMREEGR